MHYKNRFTCWKLQVQGYFSVLTICEGSSAEWEIRVVG